MCSTSSISWLFSGRRVSRARRESFPMSLAAITGKAVDLVDEAHRSAWPKGRQRGPCVGARRPRGASSRARWTVAPACGCPDDRGSSARCRRAEPRRRRHQGVGTLPSGSEIPNSKATSGLLMTFPSRGSTELIERAGLWQLPRYGNGLMWPAQTALEIRHASNGQRRNRHSHDAIRILLLGADCRRSPPSGCPLRLAGGYRPVTSSRPQ